MNSSKPELLSKIKKAGKTVDFKRKKIFLEYDLQSELMKRTTNCATIKELHELQKNNNLADCDQLMAEGNLILQEKVSKVVKLDRNFEDNQSLKVVLAMKISMEIAYCKIIDLVVMLGETS
ncbi:hypothetical protein EJD97_015345 [Solanum chilense]|uniref:Uncharacterized protein n=1 Tax=Solanum chilense TaxID=4083 RepID=A0A6N2B7Y8_SOLCI|nr:hypothetical protein EJD97_015345 [Solanum chilense]